MSHTDPPYLLTLSYAKMGLSGSGEGTPLDPTLAKMEPRNGAPGGRSCRRPSTRGSPPRASSHFGFLGKIKFKNVCYTSEYQESMATVLLHWRVDCLDCRSSQYTSSTFPLRARSAPASAQALVAAAAPFRS